MSSFIKHTELDYYWNNLTDLRPKEEVIDDIIENPNMLIKSRKVQLRCLNCGKICRSVYTGKKCTCGHYLIYTGTAIRRAAKALHNAGFKLHGAYDGIVSDSSDTSFCFACIDFAAVYDEKCFFELIIPLLDDWICRTLKDSDNRIFTRLYCVNEVETSKAGIEEKAELKYIAADLEYWGREAEDVSAAAVMTLAGWGSFWRIPGI